MKLNTKVYEEILKNTYEGIYILDLKKKITYWNRGAEGITGYKAEEVLGTSCGNQILNIDKNGKQLCNTNRCVAEKVFTSKKPYKKELYLQHKKGHRLLIVIRAFPAYNIKGKMIGVVEIFSNKSTQLMLKNKTKELQQYAMVDKLTNISNRRYLEIQLHGRQKRLQRYKWPFGILFADIDKFKSINDTYGHDVGDKVLIAVAKTLQQGIRSYDIVGRWGGEEFVISIENLNKKQLISIGKKLCKLIKNTSIEHEKRPINVKISIGATMAKADDTIVSLIQRADKLMYKSKAQGGNRVTIG